MTKYKSELTQILNEIEEVCVKVEDEQMTYEELIEFLDDIYNRLNECRVELEDHVRDLNDVIDGYTRNLSDTINENGQFGYEMEI